MVGGTGDTPVVTDAMNRAAQHLLRGRRRAARRWLRRAGRAASHPDTLYRIGHAFHTELHEPAEAVPYYSRAADAGHVAAMNNLGLVLKETGAHAAAERWLLRAARTGDLDAAHNLARLLQRTGRADEALDWYLAAAAGGLVDDMLNAGMLLTARGRHDEAREWFRRAGEAGHPLGEGLARAIGERAAGAGPPSAADRLLDAAGEAYRRYGTDGDRGHLARGLDLVGRALDDNNLPRAVRAEALVLRGVLLRLRYERDRDTGALAAAVEAGRAGVALSEPGDTYYGAHLASLGSTLHEEFNRTGDLPVIDEAIALHRQAVDAVPADHPDRVPAQSNLAGALLVRAGAVPDEAVLTEAVLLSREVVRATPPGHPGRATFAVNLGAALLTLLRERPDHVLADEAADTYDEALRLLPPAHPLRPGIEANRATAHALRDALRADLAAASPAPPDGDAAAGDLLLARYEATGSAADLRQALTLLAAAHARAADQDTRRSTALSYATALWSLAERTGGRDAMDRSAALFTTVLDTAPPDHPDAGTAHTSLGSVLLMRWRTGGDPDDLDAAVDHQRAALDGAPEGHPRRAGRLSALAGTLLARCQAYGDSAALAEATGAWRESLALAADPSEAAGIASNLSIALRSHPEPTADDLDEAVDRARDAVRATPPGRLLHARFTSNLALALIARHHAAGDGTADLTEAAEAAERAVAGTPLDHPARIDRLATLAETRHLLYQADPAPGALDALVRAAEQAVTATPPGHLLRVRATSLLGFALVRKAMDTRDDALSRQARDLLRQAATDPAGPVRERVSAATRWAAATYVTEGPEAALAPFTLAVELLARTAPRRIGRADQERGPARFQGLAADAAACAMACGRPDRAVALLETGRGVLLAQALDTRTDLTRLRAAHPDDAARLTALRAVLDAVPAAPGAAGAPPDRHTAARAWDDLVAAVRRRPGFADFLLPPPVDRFLTALDGRTAAVLVNVSHLRSDALILHGGRLTSVPLPGIEPETVRRRAEDFLTAVTGRAASRAGRVARRRIVADTLDWLWRDLADPVLTALGHTAALPDGTPDRPRVCWLPTGLLTVLPLHAAQAADPADGAVLDRVVSSYAPTLRALVRGLDARRPPAPGAAPLVVALAETPGAAPLPGAAAEAALHVERHPGARLLSGADATRAAVLDALPAHDLVHFACHAMSPDRVLLHDHGTRPLTVPDISALDLPAAYLAYLAACSTTRARPDLADEAVHITGAFQLAGYRHVVGSLWQIDDRSAPRVADAFYRALAAGAAPHRALHDAVRELRAREPGAPELWGAYVHVSAAG
ncbi:CHAT domain-containing protein [Streptomyces sp. RFCAC02]|uniref:CHAT domain-containing protein n=1 Tax=Streptomyces sp. RFCAC02 TaxID=2499143 RepID=UPI00101F453A|nr:CHAT domain-containing protein [Streptomyces sp. RFCAC02]